MPNHPNASTSTCVVTLLKMQMARVVSTATITLFGAGAPRRVLRFDVCGPAVITGVASQEAEVDRIDSRHR